MVVCFIMEHFNAPGIGSTRLINETHTLQWGMYA